MGHSGFEKNYIVWKLKGYFAIREVTIVWEELYSMETQFLYKKSFFSLLFEKNYIVWKLSGDTITADKKFKVWEELYSMETMLL